MRYGSAMTALQPGAAIVTASPDETAELAARLLRELPARRVLALHGDLGSGKTCFVQGLALALGITDYVTSPTFTIVREYAGPRPLVHIDLYRIRSPDELLNLGFEEYLEGPALLAIEWAERAGDLLPADTLHLTFTVEPAPERRRITLA